MKLLWDVRIQTDHPLEHKKPVIVVLNKEDRTCLVLDVACHFDTGVNSKEKEKINKYQDLKRDLARIWKCKTAKVVSIIIDALGILPKGLEKWLKKIEMSNLLELLQRACILYAWKS